MNNSRKYFECQHKAMTFGVDLMPHDCWDILRDVYSEKQLENMLPKTIVNKLADMMQTCIDVDDMCMDSIISIVNEWLHEDDYVSEVSDLEKTINEAKSINIEDEYMKDVAGAIGFEVYNTKYKVEVLRVRKCCNDTKLIVELRHTKNNIITLDGDIVKPRNIEFYSSGTIRLWYSHKTAKSFGAYSFPCDVKLLNAS